MKDKLLNKDKLIISFMLLFISAFIDIIGLLIGGKVLLSFMGGNTTNFSHSLATLDFSNIEKFGLILLFFMFGAFVGNFIMFKSNNKLSIFVLVKLGIIGIIFGLSFFINERYIFLLLTFMIGFHNNIKIIIEGVVISQSFVTGTIHAIGKELSKIIFEKKDYIKLILQLFKFISIIAGAIIGAIFISSFSLQYTLFFIIVWYLVLFVYIEIESKNNVL